jgi:hypothetical protein
MRVLLAVLPASLMALLLRVWPSLANISEGCPSCPLCP